MHTDSTGKPIQIRANFALSAVCSHENVGDYTLTQAQPQLDHVEIFLKISINTDAFPHLNCQ